MGARSREGHLLSVAIRNFCIIAHVDHGKTTLVDHLLRQAGTFRAHESVQERVMDSDDQERERGITISAKNAVFFLGSTKVNIVDTPGHADFGGEVERVMGMVDGALLLVDAAEGPLPQTRFVLQKAIQRGLRILVCINKVDRPEVRHEPTLVGQCVDRVFDLFVELGASDAQADFPILYACAREGWCTLEREDIVDLVERKRTGDLSPLFQLILDLPPPTVDSRPEFSMLVANIAYSDYLGSLAIGRIVSGSVAPGQALVRHGRNGAPKEFQATAVLTFRGMEQVQAQSLSAGDIGIVAGCGDLEIGDTLSDLDVEALPRITVEEPTMRMIFAVNSTPQSGRDGKAIQSRELRERLLKEVRGNVALRLEDTDQPDQFYLLGRGELQFGIIIEKLRREGLEFMVGRPNVLMQKDDHGQRMEPFERLVLDLPGDFAGDVTRLYQERKGILSHYETLSEFGNSSRVRLCIDLPTRGVLGTHSQFKTATRGTGIMSSEFLGYRGHVGDLAHRRHGCLIADRTGSTTAYALETLQERGELFVGEGVDVYEGMIIGECAKENDLNVNPCRPKKLTNVRTHASDGITMLHPPRPMTLERCIEWIDEDEWIEVTPKTVRMRKKILSSNQRSVRREDRVDS